MIFDFYELVAGSAGVPVLQLIKASRIELPWSHEVDKQRIQSAIATEFDAITSKCPDMGLVLVISPTLGRAPGTIVAAELSKATKPPRELLWLHETWGDLFSQAGS